MEKGRAHHRREAPLLSGMRKEKWGHQCSLLQLGRVLPKQLWALWAQAHGGWARV